MQLADNAMPTVAHPPQTRARVIEEFQRTGRVDLACASAGCERSSHYRWLREDEDYRKAFEQARDEVNGLLEDEAVRRAYHGTMKPMAIGGKVHMVTEFSDHLLTFLLKCRNRKVFGDKSEDTLHVDGELSVADVIRQRRARRLAEEAAIEVQAQPQIAGPDEG